MEMESLQELIYAIYEDVKNDNEARDLYAVPQSDTFYNTITEKYNLIPFKIPTLMRILINSHMIFSIDIVKEDRKQKIRRIEGFIVTKGDIINDIKRVYEDELSRLYAIEFNKKLPGDKAVEVFSSHIDEFNNTPIGRVGSTAYQLTQLGKVLEWDIMKYSQKSQESLLEKEIEAHPEITSFVSEPKKSDKGAPVDRSKAPSKNIKTRPISSHDYEKFVDYSKLNSVEKTINVYGIDFYTRVCFRDYNYSLIGSHIKKGIIHKKSDLFAVKKMLLRERANADNDSKIQEYAVEINKLEKEINSRLKSLQ